MIFKWDSEELVNFLVLRILILNLIFYAWQKEWVPTLRFDPIANWVIKLETRFVDGSARCYDYNNPNGRPDDWVMYAIKTSFSF